MKTIAYAAAALAACLAAPAVAAPLDAYGRLPTIERAKISPDGAELALVVTNGEHRRVAVERLSDNAIVFNADAGERKVRDIEWAGADHLLLTTRVTQTVLGVDAPKAEYLVAMDIDVPKQTGHRIMTGVTNTLAAVIEPPAIRYVAGKPVAFVEGYHFVGDYGQVSLFKVDLDSDRTTLLADGSPRAMRWLVDPNGAPLAEEDFDSASGDWTLRVKRQGLWRVAMTRRATLGGPTLLGLGRDGRSLLLTDDGDEDQDALRELAPDASDWSQPFALGDDEDLVFDPTTQALIGVYTLVADKGRYTFFNADDQVRWNAALNAFPGDALTLESMSANHKRFVVLDDSPTEGPAYYLVDIDAKSAVVVGPQYARIGAGDVAPARSIAFKAADGLSLSGYLTTPLGRPDRGLPLVVFPHGGPAVRDGPGFDWWVQAIASRGYAVLQVNYRGSAGFGWAFQSKGFGEWGRKMQTDLSDGVRDLAAEGVIDPKRVCIVGASYGGYAALAGAALDPGVYRCAVAVSGVSDVRRFISWDRQHSDISAQRYWDRYMGVTRQDDPVLSRISPIDHVDAITIPILLIHGKDDTTVPFEQSLMMAEALKHAGKPVDLIALESEDHYLSRGETRLQMLQASIDFLEKNNPPN
jgi:dipeptidyl aminopeptidase/acylaminoacyl peptidase